MNCACIPILRKTDPPRIDIEFCPLHVAAPELLEALEGIEKWWVEVGQYLYVGAPAEIFNVRAAIRKAKDQERPREA